MNNIMIELEKVKCNLCSSDSYILLFEARDYRFGIEGEYRIVKCNNCGLVYINPRPTSKSILKLYEEYYTSENDSAIFPKRETTKWKKILKKIWHRINGQYIDEMISQAEGRVLDIGCGNGYFLLPLTQKGCEVYGIETNPKSVKICKEMGLNVFCTTLEEAKFPDEFFDTVIMSQVIEHLPSPKNSLKEIRRILKRGGKLYIFCPNAESYLSKFFGKYWHGWHIPFHFYAFTEETIQKFAEQTGLVVKKTKAVTPDNFFTVSLKSYLYGENDNGRRPVERGRLFDSLLFRATISPILRILDLVLTGKGDCLKVVLTKVQK